MIIARQKTAAWIKHNGYYYNMNHMRQESDERMREWLTDMLRKGWDNLPPLVKHQDDALCISELVHL